MMNTARITAAGVVLLVAMVSVLIYRSSDDAHRNQRAAADAGVSAVTSPAGRDAQHTIDSATALNAPRIDSATVAARSCTFLQQVRFAASDVEPDVRYVEFRLRAQASTAGANAIVTSDQRLRAPIPNADAYRCAGAR